MCFELIFLFLIFLVCWGRGGVRAGIVSNANFVSWVSISFSLWLQIIDLAAFGQILIFVTISFLFFLLCVALFFLHVSAEVDTETLVDCLSALLVSIPCSCSWHCVHAVVVVFFFLFDFSLIYVLLLLLFVAYDAKHRCIWLHTCSLLLLFFMTVIQSIWAIHSLATPFSY